MLELDGVELAFGDRVLLDQVNLVIQPGERICLLGRNGAGKSTLMRVIEGTQGVDDGRRRVREGLRIARLEQDIPANLPGSVFEVVAQGLEKIGRLLAEWHQASQAVATRPEPEQLEALARCQQALEAQDGWAWQQQVEQVLSRLQLPAEQPFARLSGGQRRRVLLARALVKRPDLLLLDEPTNHLDIESIQWLEDFLLRFEGSLLFITHDRAFLRRLASRIIELDRGRLTSWPGDYERYLRHKAEALHAEAQEQARFDRKLAEEEVWIRKGIQARRTRNEGRVRALEAMREQRRRRREVEGQARLQMQQAEASGKRVIEAENLCYSWGDQPLVKDFSTTILRGDKVGLIGPNGVGKTTLLRLLLGQLQPTAGRVRTGTRLQLAWFDQYRELPDEHLRVQDVVADGQEFIQIGGQKRHVMAWLKDFLFPPDRCRQPVSALSGGERSRLLLARLFARPFNLLVMDEPTNDLDLETLELLEEKLLEFDGTLLLVSHDREFLDRVVTSSLVFEGKGRIREVVGGYSDWLRQRPEPAAEKTAPAPRAEKPRATGRRKLSYNDQRELEQLPARIEALEQAIEALQQEMADPGFYRRQAAEISEAGQRLQQMQQELEQAYERWASLEAQTDQG